MDIKTQNIFEKIKTGKRINADEGLFLYEHADLAELGLMADFIKRQKFENKVFFNRNFHLEPTNVCIHGCKFCSYSRKQGEQGSWELSMEELLETVKKYADKRVTEVHVVGGVHPDRDLNYYCQLIAGIKSILPEIHIKAFTAVELDYMFKKGKISAEEGLKKLKNCGLNSIPGGGAEIFDPQIRKKVCHEKSDSTTWLAIHQKAHLLGIPSNATMLYGHIEDYSHRIDHLQKLRELQDLTNGFNAFIPLKFKNKNNLLSGIREVNYTEELRNYAVSRIFLDNIPHIKAYWPMSGKDLALLSLSFGADDMDGTIDDSTKIYSMAGSEEAKPTLTSSVMIRIIKDARHTPVERDSEYNELQIFS
ncbi:MAG: aminofutalosine synthase MqnE [Bacteroidetes bacterium GWF2_38_335]|nr:MAG: aminofutalosine synthase MqnE [Bacteroidetes bacterium GWF2_38_335]OFY77803.1 MAG: aminofutalosine synthase MqnE [Bacteroidetes bacterium RIFOXYA12_FULL_38_20]HBS87391.1 aminofutalosine synthase MqnE [Bacteroidales bacterium]